MARIINHHGNVEEVSAPTFTEGPWFVHDFRGASSNPTVRDITVSCDHPATITVCSMDRALTAEPEEALANARLIATTPKLYQEAVFLCERLRDLERVTNFADDVVDYFQHHVLPSIARLEMLLAQARGEQ